MSELNNNLGIIDCRIADSILLRRIATMEHTVQENIVFDSRHRHFKLHLILNQTRTNAKKNGTSV